jgi:signal transduction histidine kinase
LSLKLKIALVFSGLLLLAVGSLSAVLARSATRALARERDEDALKRAAGLAEVCRGTIFSQQDLQAANYLRRLKSSPEILEAFCVDKEGKVVGHTSVERVGENAGENLRRELAGLRAPRQEESGGRLTVDTPVTLDGLPLGAARIVFDGAALKERLSREMTAARWRVWRHSLPIIALGFFATFLLTGVLIKPLEDVVSGARAIGRGTLTHVIPVGRRDEIGLLATEVNRMAARLKELDEMKRDFVNGVTHDLKSPLAGILAAAEAARTDDRSARDEQLAVVRRKAENLSNLITSILEVAKIESGLVLNRKRVRLEEVVDRVAAAHAPEAARKGLLLEHVMEAAPPPLSLDETKIERVLGNLVGNAVKFTDKGSVIVRTGLDGNFATVRVEDTGPGLAPELEHRLFTKFSRAAGGEAARKEGSGLGLAIAKGIAEAHGGSISVESVPGRTVFTVRLPRE